MTFVPNPTKIPETVQVTAPTVPTSQESYHYITAAESEIAKVETSVKSIISQVKATNWKSEISIDSLVTKIFAALAAYHPGLSVGKWEPAIIAGALSATVIESGIRKFLSTHSVASTLSAMSDQITALKS